MEFRDRLIDESEIAEILNAGARDTNKYNALKYVEKIIEYKGLIGGIGDKMVIEIPGLSEIKYEIDESMIKDSREDIETFLFGENGAVKSTPDNL